MTGIAAAYCQAGQSILTLFRMLIPRLAASPGTGGSGTVRPAPIVTAL